jgi:uncharacterized protein (TIGR00297 family)
LVAASAVALVALRARSLSPSGALAAAAAGTAAVAAGWDWALLLIAYFVSSTLLSRVGRLRKAQRTAGMIEKAGARDAWQVLANGLPFLAAAVVAATGTGPVMLWMAIGAGCLAASAADTWATEVGTLAGGSPRSILTGRTLTVGQSGGITAIGLLASLAGAGFIAFVVGAISWPSALLLPTVAGGVTGSIVDSLLGATIQQRRWCDACDQATEMSIHTCGQATRRIGGAPMVGNDAVNLLAVTLGAGVAALLARS